MIVFAGPSIVGAYRARHPQIDWRPPAIAGDLLALVNLRPDKVLLIDGLFDEQASVKHKEAIAIMAEGTRLYGASSMGALRAAELSGFGMIPLGRIAAAYCHGRLTGDDEVALVHGNERMGWKAASVPMVEVRATLCRALRDRIVRKAEAKTLRTLWHDIHFVDRDWPLMIDAASNIVSKDVARQIGQRHVPLKQWDAEAAIEFALSDNRKVPASPPPEPTLFFDRLRAGLSRD